MTPEEFDALYAEVAAGDDPRGTLRHLTAARVVAATRLVTRGDTVSLAVPLATEPGIANPSPAEHHMTRMPDDNGAVGFAKDYVGLDFHNEGHTHIDALCHVAYHGTLYNGHSIDTVTADGASADAIDLVAGGLVGRGVLLDVPRARGVPWLEPGELVSNDDLQAAESAQGVEVGAGDFLLIATGHDRRLEVQGGWDIAQAKAGLDPTVARFLTARQVSVLGSDANHDAAPSPVEGIGYPLHVLAVHAMGMHVLDYLRLTDLAQTCAMLGRWAFLCVVAPLRVEGGTGSPVNPIAVF